MVKMQKKMAKSLGAFCAHCRARIISHLCRPDKYWRDTRRRVLALPRGADSAAPSSLFRRSRVVKQVLLRRSAFFSKIFQHKLTQLSRRGLLLSLEIFFVQDSLDPDIDWKCA